VRLLFDARIIKRSLLGFGIGLTAAVWSAELAAAPLALDAGSINTAGLPGRTQRNLAPALVARAQILLDQNHFSPGEIDAREGENFTKALRAFAKAFGLPFKSGLPKELWLKLMENASGPALTEYQITEDDIRGPFAPDLPTKMEDMKDLPAVPYRSAAEGLAEKFHMSEELLKALNAGSSFDRAGETILVANVRGSPEPPTKAARVEVEKAGQTIRVLDAANNIVAYYPATVGSEEKPSPSGTLKVKEIHANPNYRYNPKYRFREVRSAKPFTIKPGPNNPVGSMWIGLSAEGYGIHGSPEPSKISKAESHGCIRLTNWDAHDLSRRLAKGAPVVFLDRVGEADNRKKKRKTGAG
jgi:lipoprotein-anchoring transpeptidase ErfK/SrfK